MYKNDFFFHKNHKLRLYNLKKCIVFEAEQYMWPPNMPLWHVNYFDLKAIKTQQSQEKFYLSINYKNYLDCQPDPEREY